MTLSPSPFPSPVPFVTAEKLAGGNIRLRWTGPVGDGTRYQLWRQVDGHGDFEQLGGELAGGGDGGVGGGRGLEANTFTDTALSKQTKTASYYVVTLRSDGTSAEQSDPVTVNLEASEAA